jgi:hypothetical protein
MARRALRGLLALLLVACGASAVRPPTSHDLARAQRGDKPRGGGGGAPAAGSCAPRGVHLALTGAPGEVRVAWSTARAGCGSRVRYGRAGWAAAVARLVRRGGAPAAAEGAEREWRAEEVFCAAPAADSGEPPAHLHSAVLEGLAPGARHWYAVEDGGAAGGDARFEFRAPAAPGPAAALRFLAYGDMGEPAPGSKCPGAAPVAAALAAEVAAGADLLLHVGDVSYADGRAGRWDAFMALVEPAAARAPLHVAAGNHDVGWARAGPGRPGEGLGDAAGAAAPYTPRWGNYGADSGGECGWGLKARFQMPGDAALEGGAADLRLGRHPAAAGLPPNNAPFWYEFAAGPVHFLVISTEHDVGAGSPQRAWLDAALARAAGAACAAPWLVLAAHRPLYVPRPHKANAEVGEHLRGALEPALLAAGVDLVLSGHVHAYSRSCAVAEGRCVGADARGAARAPTHVVAGTGGKALSGAEALDRQPEWLAAAAARHGYGRVDVAPRGGRLRYEFVDAVTGAALDSFELAAPRNLKKCK